MYTFLFSACPSECEKCDKDDLCTECATGFYIDAGICSKCTAKCTDCSEKDSCNSCSPATFWDSENKLCNGQL